MTPDTAPALSFTFSPGSADELFAIELPADPRAIFGRVRAPVIVTVADHRYRSTVAVMGGRTFVPLRREHQQAAGVHIGGSYAVTLTLDTEPRTVTPPDDLLRALDAAELRGGWDVLSYTARRELADAITAAKRPATREKRVAAALAAASRRTGRP